MMKSRKGHRGPAAAGTSIVSSSHHNSNHIGGPQHTNHNAATNNFNNNSTPPPNSYNSNFTPHNNNLANSNSRGGGGHQGNSPPGFGKGPVGPYSNQQQSNPGPNKHRNAELIQSNELNSAGDSLSNSNSNSNDSSTIMTTSNHSLSSSGGGTASCGPGSSTGGGDVSGAYLNLRLTHATTSLTGCIVQVQTKRNEIYEGVYDTFSPQFEIVLDQVIKVTDRTKNNNGQMSGAEVLATELESKKELITPQMIFNIDDVVKLKAINVDRNYAVGSSEFKTDTEISRNANAGVERELVPWDGGDDDESFNMSGNGGLDLDHADGGTANGWDPEAMFELNKEKFDVVTDFPEDLDGYTMKLDKKNTEEFRQREEEAARVAAEIEGDSRSKARLVYEVPLNEADLSDVKRVTEPDGERYDKSKQDLDDFQPVTTRRPHDSKRGARGANDDSNWRNKPPARQDEYRPRKGQYEPRGGARNQQDDRYANRPNLERQPSGDNRVYGRSGGMQSGHGQLSRQPSQGYSNTPPKQQQQVQIPQQPTQQQQPQTSATPNPLPTSNQPPTNYANAVAAQHSPSSIQDNQQQQQQQQNIHTGSNRSSVPQGPYHQNMGGAPQHHQGASGGGPSGPPGGIPGGVKPFPPQQHVRGMEDQRAYSVVVTNNAPPHSQMPLQHQANQMQHAMQHPHQHPGMHQPPNVVIPPGATGPGASYSSQVSNVPIHQQPHQQHPQMPPHMIKHQPHPYQQQQQQQPPIQHVASTQSQHTDVSQLQLQQQTPQTKPPGSDTSQAKSKDDDNKENTSLTIATPGTPSTKGQQAGNSSDATGSSSPSATPGKEPEVLQKSKLNPNAKEFVFSPRAAPAASAVSPATHASVHAPVSMQPQQPPLHPHQQQMQSPHGAPLSIGHMPGVSIAPHVTLQPVTPVPAFITHVSGVPPMHTPQVHITSGPAGSSLPVINSSATPPSASNTPASTPSNAPMGGQVMHGQPHHQHGPHQHQGSRGGPHQHHPGQAATQQQHQQQPQHSIPAVSAAYGQQLAYPYAMNPAQQGPSQFPGSFIANIPSMQRHQTPMSQQQMPPLMNQGPGSQAGNVSVGHQGGPGGPPHHNKHRGTRGPSPYHNNAGMRQGMTEGGNTGGGFNHQGGSTAHTVATATGPPVQAGLPFPSGPMPGYPAPNSTGLAVHATNPYQQMPFPAQFHYQLPLGYGDPSQMTAYLPAMQAGQHLPHQPQAGGQGGPNQGSNQQGSGHSAPSTPQSQTPNAGMQQQHIPPAPSPQQQQQQSQQNQQQSNNSQSNAAQSHAQQQQQSQMQQQAAAFYQIPPQFQQSYIMLQQTGQIPPHMLQAHHPGFQHVPLQHGQVTGVNMPHAVNMYAMAPNVIAQGGVGGIPGQGPPLQVVQIQQQQQQQSQVSGPQSVQGGPPNQPPQPQSSPMPGQGQASGGSNSSGGGGGGGGPKPGGGPMNKGGRGGGGNRNSNASNT